MNIELKARHSRYIYVFYTKKTWLSSYANLSKHKLCVKVNIFFQGIHKLLFVDSTSNKILSNAIAYLRFGISTNLHHDMKRFCLNQSNNYSNRSFINPKSYLNFVFWCSDCKTNYRIAKCRKWKVSKLRLT